MRVGHKQMVDEIVFLDRRCLLATAATTLCAVVGQWLRLDVASVRQGHHHVLRRDQILDAEVLRMSDDLRATLVAELRLDRGQLIANDFGNALGAIEDVHQIGNALKQLAVIGHDLVALETGQALQTQLKDSLSLRIGEQVALLRQAELDTKPVRARRIHGRTSQHFANRHRGPQTPHQATLGISRRWRGLDQGNDFIDVIERNRQTFLSVRLLARLAQFEDGTTCHDFTTVRKEAHQHLLQVQEARLAIDQCHHVHAEGILELRLLVQIVQHHFRNDVALELNHHAHAGFVRLILNVRNAFDLLFVDQLGNLFEQGALVHLIRQLVDDDRLLVALFQIFDVRASAHHHTAAASVVAIAHTGNAVDEAGGREVRRRNDVDQLINRHFRIGQQRQTAIDHFIEVVRRDIGRHADRDTRRAVNQQVRDLRRHDQRFLL